MAPLHVALAKIRAFGIHYYSKLVGDASPVPQQAFDVRQIDLLLPAEEKVQRNLRAVTEERRLSQTVLEHENQAGVVLHRESVAPAGVHPIDSAAMVGYDKYPSIAGYGRVLKMKDNPRPAEAVDEVDAELVVALVDKPSDRCANGVDERPPREGKQDYARQQGHECRHRSQRQQ